MYFSINFLSVSVDVLDVVHNLYIMYRWLGIVNKNIYYATKILEYREKNVYNDQRELIAA